MRAWSSFLKQRDAAASKHILEYWSPGDQNGAERMWKPIVAISLGGSLGSVLRWWLGTTLNAYFPTMPPGTLTANLVGGYLIGLAVAFFATFSALAPEWRLFVITGFCGGLTTFSTFSAEIVTLLQQGRALWALGAVAVHLVGSILMTFAGIGTVVWLRSQSGQ
jgi:CrcB protein